MKVWRTRSGRLPFFGLWFLRRETGSSSRAPRGKVGNLPWVFHFPIRGEAELWECGNLARWARFPRDGGKRGKAVLAFPRFPRARHFHSSLRAFRCGAVVSSAPLQALDGDSILHRRNSCALATVILRAHSVSLIFRALCSRIAMLMPGFKYCSGCSSPFSFSYGVA
jgi:hypothetical protein